MAKKKVDPNSTQAQADALVRFGPEYSALAGLLRDAEENRDNQLRQARTGRDLALSEISQANPVVQNAYQGAQQAVQPAFAQGGGIEAQALQARLGEAGALAKTQLESRRLGAIQGASSEGMQALRQFGVDRGKVQQRAMDLGQEQGAFITSQIAQGRAADAAAQAQADELNARLKQSERGSQYSAGIDPDTGLPIPGGKLDPAAHPGKPNQGRGWASQERQAGAGDEISRLLDAAKDLKADPTVTRQEAYSTLSEEVPSKSTPVFEVVKDSQGRPVKDINGKVVRQPKMQPDRLPDGSPNPRAGEQITHTVPGIPAAKSKLLLQAALDMAYDGHLSRRTQDLLHKRGIQLGPLGLTTFQDWLKTPEGKAWLATQRHAKTPAQAIPGVGNAVG